MRSDRNTRRRALVAGAAVGITALASALVTTSTASAAEGPVLRANQADSVAGSYIVHFKPSAGIAQANVGSRAGKLAGAHGGKVTRVFDVFGGFAVDMNEAQAKKLAADPSVLFVEQDFVVKASDEQPNATWGLDRVDQRNLPLDSKYKYPTDAGKGVTAYIVDTGLDYSHSEFTGRTKPGYDFIDNDSNAADCHGHGTHVAGTIAGSTYGLAKKATVVGVRVLDCSGYSKGSSVEDGLNWVAKNATKPAVVNMSLGGGASSSLDNATKATINAGVITVVAAGNDNRDACNVSPARTPEAITVAASDNADKRSIWQAGTLESNYGTCVDLFAPGTSITSAKNGGGTTQMSGTSMATPHVAGAATVYLGLSGNSGKTQAEVAKVILDASTPNKITDTKNSPNKLLYTGDWAGGGTPGTPQCAAQTNTNDVSIPDNGGAVSSSVTTPSGCGQNSASVKVDIVHSYSADLKVELVSPGGQTYLLQAARGVGSADGIHTTYTADVTGSTNKTGTWKLQVTDGIAYDTGYIDSWTLTV